MQGIHAGSDLLHIPLQHPVTIYHLSQLNKNTPCYETQSSGSNNLAFVKVSQVLTLAHSS